MRISAIQGTGNVYARKNLRQASPIRHTNDTTVQAPAGQEVAFKGLELKVGLACIGACLGGLIIGGPVGAIVGAAAGLKGAMSAEEEEEAKKNEKDKKDKK